ncbi:MAG: DUF3293 domain-containing protein [Candidatus Sericytochromatia bacterium]|nr:DUF3293 domain-containing protein [Candidatus Sericytochromatia bacterium]
MSLEEGQRPPFPDAYRHTIFRGPGATPPFPESFAIVTAWATTGEVWPVERNLDASGALESRLQGLGLPHLPLTGEAPDGTHIEPSWRVETSMTQAVALGLEFLQHAIYWVHEDRLYVVLCAPDRPEPWLIGRWREQLRS